MVHSFPLTAAHATPPCHYIPFTHKIITSQNPAPSCSPDKESHPRRSFNFPNAFPGEIHPHPITQSIVKRAGCKNPILAKSPTQYISFLDPKGSLFSTYWAIWHCKGFRQGRFNIKMVFLDSVIECLVKKKQDCLFKMHFEHASAIGRASAILVEAHKHKNSDK